MCTQKYKVHVSGSSLVCLTDRQRSLVTEHSQHSSLRNKPRPHQMGTDLPTLDHTHTPIAAVYALAPTDSCPQEPSLGYPVPTITAQHPHKEILCAAFVTYHFSFWSKLFVFLFVFFTINSVTSGSISESTLCNPQQATYCQCLKMCSMQRHRMMWPEWGHAKLLTFVQASWLRFSLEDSHRYSCACRWVQAWSPQSSSEEEGNEWEVGDRTIRGSNEKTPEANKRGMWA